VTYASSDNGFGEGYVSDGSLHSGWQEGNPDGWREDVTDSVPRFEMTLGIVDLILDTAAKIVHKRPYATNDLLRKAETELKDAVPPFEQSVSKAEANSRIVDAYKRFEEIAALAVLYEHNV